MKKLFCSFLKVSGFPTGCGVRNVRRITRSEARAITVPVAVGGAHGGKALHVMVGTGFWVDRQTMRGQTPGERGSTLLWAALTGECPTGHGRRAIRRVPVRVRVRVPVPEAPRW